MRTISSHPTGPLTAPCWRSVGRVGDGGRAGANFGREGGGRVIRFASGGSIEEESKDRSCDVDEKRKVNDVRNQGRLLLHKSESFLCKDERLLCYARR